MVRMMLNKAMRIERENSLDARTYKLDEKRQERANGHKTKTVWTLVVEVTFGQFLFGVIADTVGLAGLARIPLDLRRVIGLAVMAVSVILLLPRK